MEARRQYGIIQRGGNMGCSLTGILHGEDHLLKAVAESGIELFYAFISSMLATCLSATIIVRRAICSRLYFLPSGRGISLLLT